MNEQTELQHYHAELCRQDLLSYFERHGQARPPDFEQVAAASAAIDFASLNPAQLQALRLHRAVCLETEKLGGRVARCRLPDGTPMRWRELETLVRQTPIADDAAVVVLHLIGHQPGGFPGCAERLIEFLKGDCRRLVLAVDADLYSASAWLLAAADKVIATARSSFNFHCGHRDAGRVLQVALEDDLHVYPGVAADLASTADGSTSPHRNAHAAERDALAFYPRFAARFAGADGEGSVEDRLRSYFAAPIFTQDVRKKLLGACRGATNVASDTKSIIQSQTLMDVDATNVALTAFGAFWQAVHNDFLFTKIGALEAHALGVIDILVS